MNCAANPVPSRKNVTVRSLLGECNFRLRTPSTGPFMVGVKIALRVSDWLGPSCEVPGPVTANPAPDTGNPVSSQLTVPELLKTIVTGLGRFSATGGKEIVPLGTIVVRM